MMFNVDPKKTTLMVVNNLETCVASHRLGWHFFAEISKAAWPEG